MDPLNECKQEDNKIMDSIKEKKKKEKDFFYI